ncbi:MAG: insulinase family protein [Saprospiraceae bacterium]|nr:insulinase family protein [Saprospiraceae bacterium]
MNYKVSIAFISIVLLACTPKQANFLSVDAPLPEATAMASISEQPQLSTPPLESTGGNQTDDKGMAPQDPLQGQPIPMDPRVRMGKLANGMHYYIQQNQKPENRAELRLAVAAGSINEDDDQLGLAHFVEHMAFNGTKNFEKSELVDYLQSVGTKFGPDLNAYTSFDETVYMLQVRTDSQDLFDKGMLILEDWAHAVTFEDEEIDKERGVVESELRSGLSADERMRNEYLPVIFYNSKYANRIPIGTREIINGAPYETLRRFYQDWYRPDLMAVVVVGDIDPDAVEASIKERFSQLENPEDPREREKFGFPDHDETLVSITSDKEATFTTARVMYKHDHKPVNDLGDYRRSIVQSLYNRMLNNRLDELRRKAEPPFLFGYSGYGREVGDLDSYTAYVSTGEGEVMKGLEAVLRENRRVNLHGFTATELERTKIEMLSELETTAKEEDKMESGSLSMRYVYHFLNNNPVPSPTQRWQLGQALLPTIELEEINRIADEWITDGSNRVIVVTGPEKEGVPLPTKEEIFALVDKVEEEDIEAYVDEVSSVPLLEEMPKGGSVAEVKKIDAVGITEWNLSNGVKVVLKPTDFQNDEISFTAFSPGGTSIYPDDTYRSASMASYIISQSGIADFNLVQLEKMLAGKQVQVGPYISELEEGLQGFSTIKDLESMFQLIYLYFTDPRRDEETFTSLITRQKQILQNIHVNPNYYFQDKVNEIKYKGHLRRGIPTTEEMDEVSLDQVEEVYRDRFADASDFTFVIVGNFTPESIQPLVEKYLGGLPSIKRNETWKDVHADITPGKITDRFSYGQAPKAQVQMTWSGDFDWDDKLARYHFGSMLDVLRNKLRESMREDQGGVYGVGISGSPSKFPKENYSVIVSFNAEPDQVDTLIATAKKDIMHVMEEGPTEEDLVKVREVQRQERIKNLKENSFWVNSLKAYYHYDLDPEQLLLENYEPYVKALSPEDVQEMAKKVFGTDNFIEIVMMPGEAADTKE